MKMREGKICGEDGMALARISERIDPIKALCEDKPGFLFGLFGSRSSSDGWLDRLEDISHSISSWPEPLVRLRNFESSPGLWIIDDDKSGTIFLVFSDMYKKHPSRGTSYEAIFPATMTQDERVSSIKRLFEYIEELPSAQDAHGMCSV